MYIHRMVQVSNTKYMTAASGGLRRDCAAQTPQCSIAMVGNESPVKDEIKETHEGINWGALRATSLQPGGFGIERIDVW